MNEYTRRDETFWTLATVFVLVPAVAVAIVLLARAEGPMVTDPKAIAAEQQATAKQLQFSKARCLKGASKLGEEVIVFQTRAAGAKKKAERAAKAREKKSRYRKRGEKKKLEYEIPWVVAAPVLKHAGALYKGKCRKQTEDATKRSKSATAAWLAVSKAAKLDDPGKSGKAQQKIAKELLKIFLDAPLDKLKRHAAAANRALDARVKAAGEAKKSALVRAPLPQGLFPRGAAIGVGVGVSLAALIISYISVHSSSSRRAQTLSSLRRFANTPERGLQAAAIVRLAAHHNGGEPGMVVGSAIGGLIAALISPTDDPNIFIADLFVAGSMGGLLIGLVGQWLARTLAGVNRWRDRCKELGDIEKPSIPVALILGGVTPGLEKQFLRYFEALPVADAAMVVEKLAAQAEEQIIAAAEAAAQHGGPAGAAGPWGGPVPGAPPPPGMPM